MIENEVKPTIGSSFIPLIEKSGTIIIP